MCLGWLDNHALLQRLYMMCVYNVVGTQTLYKKINLINFIYM